MAEYNQIYELVNQVTTESIGNTAITVKDTSSLVSLGNIVLSTETNIDLFYKALPDVIGRTYVRYMELTKNDLGIQRTPLNFGIVLQKMTTENVARAVSNDSWGEQPNPFALKKDDTKIKSNLFSKISGFEIKKLIYDVQLKSAFHNAENMASFVNMIFQDMQNGMTLALNETDRLAESTAIAECLVNSNGITKINILENYNNETGKSLNVNQARMDTDFLKYASKTIKETSQIAEEVSVLYNSRGAERWLKPENRRLHILNKFSNDMAFYLNADTYNNEFVELSGYKGVNCWQGLGEKASFNDLSTVAIENENISITQSGIVGFLFDYEKIGTMIDRIRTKSIYNPAGEMTNYFHKADIGYFVDDGEIGVVFYMSTNS